MYEMDGSSTIGSGFKTFIAWWIVVGVLATTIHATIDYKTTKKVDVVFMPALSLFAAPISFLAALDRIQECGYTVVDFNKEKSYVEED